MSLLRRDVWQTVIEEAPADSQQAVWGGIQTIVTGAITDYDRRIMTRLHTDPLALLLSGKV